MKKVLIAGGSHSEMPVIEAAKQLDWYTITTGLDEGGTGHKLADKYIKGDYSDKEFILKLAKEENVDALISGANDYSYLSVAYACEKLGMPGHDSYEAACSIHNKNNFRDVLKKLGIKTPNKECIYRDKQENITLDFNFPVVVKPVDLTGGKGVHVCYSEDEVLPNVVDAFAVTRESYIIIEEYIAGTKHGFSSFIRGGKVIWHVVDNEQYGDNQYLVLGASMPSDIPQYAEYILINDIEKIAVECNLVDGLFHVQFILSEDGYPVMIDPCRRMPGDLYVLLAKYTSGLDVPTEIVKYETGTNEITNVNVEHNYIARECIMSHHSGWIKKINIDDTVKKHIIYSYVRDCEGEYINEPLKYKAGVLILKFAGYDEMMNMLDAFDDLVYIEVE